MKQKKLVVHLSGLHTEEFIIRKATNTMDYPIGSSISLYDLNELIEDGNFTVDLVGRDK